jgi:hypothetical protein
VIHAIAPTCAHCGCRIIGHGVEVGGPRVSDLLGHPVWNKIVVLFDLTWAG